jgi:hypothetical protein
MKYIDTSGTYIIGIIPRKTMFPVSGATDEFTCWLYNETTKEVATYEPYDLYEDGDIFYFQIDAIVTENTFYELTLISNIQKIIYKDRLYCTDQTITDFTINDGVYISAQTNNNNYITI